MHTPLKISAHLEPLVVLQPGKALGGQLLDEHLLVQPPQGAEAVPALKVLVNIEERQGQAARFEWRKLPKLKFDQADGVRTPQQTPKNPEKACFSHTTHPFLALTHSLPCHPLGAIPGTFAP